MKNIVQFLFISQCLVVLLDPSSALSAQNSIDHRLELTAENVHWGYYDASVDPVLRIEPGEQVYVETMIARGVTRLIMAGANPEAIPASMMEVEAGVVDRGPGAHPMTGPIYVEGAEAGDVLAVTIKDIDYLIPFGLSGFLPDGGTLPDDFPYGGLGYFDLDLENNVAYMRGTDAVIPMRPFFGSIGVAPPVLRGRVSSNPPGHHTGNLDNKELVVGTTLYLPVHVPGGLLSIGDGHAAQGDGEVSGTAIETSMSGVIEVRLHKDQNLLWPRAETPTHYVSMGLHTDLDEAARSATREMVEFLVREKGMDRGDAYILCSVALDLRVTQLVDGVKGIHGMLSKDLLP